jgi:hypothetical protein
MRYVLLCLLCLGCASGAPTTYSKGTLRPPPPAPTRPGVGLPAYEPGVRPMPPQPNPAPRRVLPQTPETRKEPGLWASEAPEATPSAGIYDKPWPVHERKPHHRVGAHPQFEAPAELMGVLPAETRKAVFRCKWVLGQAMASVEGRWEVSYFPSRMQQCANAKILLHCFETNWTEYKRLVLKAPPLADPLLERVLSDLLATAREEHRRVCTGTHLDDAVKRFVGDTTDEFDRMMEEGDGIEPHEVSPAPMPRGPRH